MIFELNQNEISLLFPILSDKILLNSLMSHIIMRKDTHVWVDNKINPEIIAISNKISSYFFCIPLINDNVNDNVLMELLLKFEDTCYIFVNIDEHNNKWKPIFEKRWNFVEKMNRWKFQSDFIKLDNLDRITNKLEERFYLRKIGINDAHLFDDEMSKLAIMIYGNLNNFLNQTLNYAIVDRQNDVIISLCSGYPFINSELEIDIRTKDEFRKRGFAKIVCKAFIQ